MRNYEQEYETLYTNTCKTGRTKSDQNSHIAATEATSEKWRVTDSKLMEAPAQHPPCCK